MISEARCRKKFQLSLSNKKQAVGLFDSLGLNLATSVIIFTKKSIAEGGPPLNSIVKQIRLNLTWFTIIEFLIKIDNQLR